MVALVLSWALMLTAQTSSQRASPDSAELAGVVVASDTGAPARLARVNLSAPGSGVLRSTGTDDQGQFAFGALPAGTYFITATKPGYLDSSFGQRQPGSGTAGTPIVLHTNQKVDGLSLRIGRGGAVSGTIIDDRGEPAYPAGVTALRYVTRAGMRTLEEAQACPTDERGIYRMGVLPPGEYLIRAQRISASTIFLNPSGTRVQSLAVLAGQAPGSAVGPTSLPAAFAPVAYYPGTVMPDEAQTVMLVAGTERTGIDVTIPLATVSSIAGAITMPDGRKVARARLFLIDRSRALAGVPSREWPTRNDGTFEIPQVPPGRYTLAARAATPPPGADGGPTLTANGSLDGGWFADAGADLLWAQADVTVGGANVTDLNLILRRGGTISGTIAYTGSLPRDPAGIIVGVQQIGFAGNEMSLAAPVPVAVDDAGRFQIPGVPPGEYRWTVQGALRGWWPHSMTIHGRDSLEGSFQVGVGQDLGDVVLALHDQAAEVSGALQDGAGKAASGYTVVLFPAAPESRVPGSRRISAVQTATDGRFLFPNLPAGAYLLAAVTDVEPGAWFDPEFLRALVGQAVSVAVEDGERKVQNLRINR